MLRWIWLAAGVIVVAVGAAFLLRPVPSQAVVLPALKLRQVDGRSLELASLKGKPLVLNAWASWCGPCRKEMPMLLEVAKANPGITFAFVNQGEGPEAVKAFEHETSLSLPLVLLDPQTQLAASLDFQGLPATFLFAAQGRLVAKHLGQLSKEQLEGYLKGL